MFLVHVHNQPKCLLRYITWCHKEDKRCTGSYKLVHVAGELYEEDFKESFGEMLLEMNAARRVRSYW